MTAELVQTLQEFMRQWVEIHLEDGQVPPELQAFFDSLVKFAERQDPL